jgi:muconolactone delta-isomerase
MQSARIASREPHGSAEELFGVQYVVTMERMEEKVPGDPQALMKHVEKVHQQHEIMIRLENEGVILAGGGVVGRKADVLIVDVASHNELLKSIYGLPLHHVRNVDVMPPADFEKELKHEREGLELEGISRLGHA